MIIFELGLCEEFSLLKDKAVAVKFLQTVVAIVGHQYTYLDTLHIPDILKILWLKQVVRLEKYFLNY